MKKSFVAVLFLSSLAFAQEKPTLPSVQPQPPANTISENSRLAYLAVYEKAIIAKKEADAAQQTFMNTLSELRNVSARIVETEKLPVGTDFNADIVSGKVTPILPPAPSIPAKPVGPAVPTSPQK